MSDDEDFKQQLAQEASAKLAERDDDGDIMTQGRTRKDSDGTVFEWDAEKKAWFPKIDEDFIASYQMNYGSEVAPTTTEPATTANTDDDYYNSEAYRDWYYKYYGSTTQTEEIPPAPEDVNSQDYYDWYYKYYGASNAANVGATPDPNDGTTGKDAADGKGKGKRKAPDPPSWFDVTEDKNTNIYISGLPPDITDDEFRDLMNKCGLIMFDAVTRKPKMKLYKDKDGKNKGDGRCCYIKSESVDLALQFLDGSEVRGHKIYVERAKFELKGKFDPSKRRRKLTKQERKKFQEKQEKLFDWRPDKQKGARNKSDKVVILKNMFDCKMFESDPTLVTAMRDKLKTECGVFGEVKKVVVYDRHTEGVVGVTFASPEDADICIEGMNGRYYAKRVVTAATWDGKTRYAVAETTQQEAERLDTWGAFLDDGETKKSGKPSESDKPADGSKSAQAESDKPSDGGKPSQAESDKPSDGSKPVQAESDKPSDGSKPAQAESDKPSEGDKPSQADNSSVKSPNDPGSSDRVSSPEPSGNQEQSDEETGKQGTASLNGSPKPDGAAVEVMDTDGAEKQQDATSRLGAGQQSEQDEVQS